MNYIKRRKRQYLKHFCALFEPFLKIFPCTLTNKVRNIYFFNEQALTCWTKDMYPNTLSQHKGKLNRGGRGDAFLDKNCQAGMGLKWYDTKIWWSITISAVIKVSNRNSAKLSIFARNFAEIKGSQMCSSKMFLRWNLETQALYWVHQSNPNIRG